MPQPLRILIADDDDRMRESLRRLLDGLGYEIETVDGGLPAMERLAGPGCDLLLLDMFLGDVNGFQVLDFVREKRLDPVVVLITGNATVESAVQALRKGAYSYLRKPFEPEELINTAEKALAHRRAERERERALRSLGESEERFRNLVENSPIGLTIIQGHRVVYRNPRQNEVFPEMPETIDPDRFDCLHPTDASKVARAYRRLLKGTDDRVEIEFRVFPGGQGQGSDMKWLQCRAGRFRYGGKNALLVNMIDVTRAREMERLVLIKDKMVSLGRVAAGIAHEIRNPLTGINSYLYTLSGFFQGDDFDPDNLDLARTITGQIRTASEKIEAVVKKVLDFTKSSQPHRRPVDLNRLARDAVGLTASTLRGAGIRLDLELAEDLPTCPADPALLEQVILNLVNNAVHVLTEGDGKKILRLDSWADAGHVFLAVSDSGPGVPPGMTQKIFEPFFSTSAVGSGIGLSLVQRIVMDHRGTVEVDAGSLGGARFLVKLPLGEEP